MELWAEMPFSRHWWILLFTKDKGEYVVLVTFLEQGGESLSSPFQVSASVWIGADDCYLQFLRI